MRTTSSHFQLIEPDSTFSMEREIFFLWDFCIWRFIIVVIKLMFLILFIFNTFMIRVDWLLHCTYFHYTQISCFDVNGICCIDIVSFARKRGINIKQFLLVNNEMLLMPNLLYGYCFYYLSTFVTEYCDIFDSSRCSTAVVSNHSIFSAHVPIVVRLQQVCRDELLSEKLKFMKYNSFCLKLKFLERLQIDNIIFYLPRSSK